ncbi:MAG: Ppx/GppA family phosphatase [Sphingomonadales bacterium]
MTRVAAIDLGTHNCRLIIGERIGDVFKTIRVQSTIVRLGEGAAKTGSLQPAAMERTIAALKRFAEIIGDEDVGEIRAVATEACRMAENCQAFIQTIREQTGLDFEIIPAREEVRLAVLASAPLIETGTGNTMMFDIGGGSTEVILLDTATTALRVLDWVSLPLGVVRGRDAMATGEVSAQEFQAQIETDGKTFAGFFEKNANFFNATIQVIGSSGTVTTLAALALGLERYHRARVDGATFKIRNLLTLAREVAAIPLEVRMANAVIGPERAEFMIPGCAIFSAIFSLAECDHLTAADRGLREGILNSMLPGAPEVVFSGQGG